MEEGGEEYADLLKQAAAWLPSNQDDEEDDSFYFTQVSLDFKIFSRFQIAEMSLFLLKKEFLFFSHKIRKFPFLKKISNIS